MQKIWLTKEEKRLLRTLANGGNIQNKWAFALYPLVQKQLVAAAREEGGGFVDARLTRAGRAYLAANPTLRNPIPWPALHIVTTLLTVAFLAAACAVRALKFFFL